MPNQYPFAADDLDCGRRTDPGSEAVPLTGTVCCGLYVELAWPHEAEFDLITNLRNRPAVRRWFLDQRPLDVVANRAWLRSGIAKPKEGLLVIRWAADGSFLGTIGWSDWDASAASACFGRLSVGARELRRIASQAPPSYAGVAVDAARALRDFAFTTMGLRSLTTWYFTANRLASHVNRAVGMRFVGADVRRSPSGDAIPTTELALSRDEWRRLVGGSE